MCYQDRVSKRSFFVLGSGIIRSVFYNKRQEIQKKLLRKNIETRPFFWPMHKQNIFIKMGLFKGESYPIAENLAKNGFLPTF